MSLERQGTEHHQELGLLTVEFAHEDCWCRTVARPAECHGNPRAPSDHECNTRWRSHWRDERPARIPANWVHRLQKHPDDALSGQSISVCECPLEIQDQGVLIDQSFRRGERGSGCLELHSKGINSMSCYIVCLLRYCIESRRTDPPAKVRHCLDFWTWRLRVEGREGRGDETGPTLQLDPFSQLDFSPFL